MKFAPWINNTLNKLKISKLTKIQELVSNVFLSNKNIIGIANTGSGKTLAFLLPILNNLKLDNNLQTIILTPTKELARQIYQVILNFKEFNKNLQPKLLIGGGNNSNPLSNNFQILISTPNKFLDLIQDKSHKLNFSTVSSIILDEADMLFDLGFFNTINDILDYLLDKNPQIKLMAFSATFHDMLANKLKKYFTNTEIINLGNKLDHNANISHNIIYNKDKFHSLSILLNTINPYFCLIFANTTKEVDQLYDYLKKQKRNVIKIHSKLLDRERKNNYKAIKNNKYTYVVCSDLLSRGMDIDGASHVISWNLPKELEWYFHRSGRTGRGQYTGYSYILSTNQNDETINRLLKHKIKFNYYQIKNNNLVKFNSKPIKKTISEEQTNEIKKVLNTKTPKKPGYKKKIKEQIKAINNKYKRKAIDNKIKQKLNQNS